MTRTVGPWRGGSVQVRPTESQACPRFKIAPDLPTARQTCHLARVTRVAVQKFGTFLSWMIMHRAGYEVVFVDVADALTDVLNAADTYHVNEVGVGCTTHTVGNLLAINSRTDADEAGVISEISGADVVTTAVGTLPEVQRPGDSEGVRRRPPAPPPVADMACEN